VRSGGNNFNYFSENKLTKFANFVQFKRMLMFCQEDWGGAGPSGPSWLRHCVYQQFDPAERLRCTVWHNSV